MCTGLLPPENNIIYYSLVTVCMYMYVSEYVCVYVCACACVRVCRS